MTASTRLCAACLLFSVLLLSVDSARRDVDPEASSTPSSVSTEDDDGQAQARCVDISVSLAACRRLGYRQMRLPSLLNVTAANTLTVGEAAAQIIGECGEDGLLLMCSLLAPVCIDRPIWPCASFCRSCGAASRSDIIDCDLLPSDDQLCIGPNSTDSKHSHHESSSETVFDARLQRPQRKKPG